MLGPIGLDFDLVLHSKVTGKMESGYDVNFCFFWNFLQNWLKYTNPPHGSFRHC